MILSMLSGLPYLVLCMLSLGALVQSLLASNTKVRFLKAGREVDVDGMVILGSHTACL